MSIGNTMHADPESSGRHWGKDGGHPAADRTARLEVAVTREMFIPGDVSDVFDFVAAQDVLPKILTGYGIVPGVASTSNVSGPWDQPGSTRIVHLLDGSTVSEGITHYNRPSYFSYRVSNPSYSPKHLMSYARGQFWFTPVEGGTQVKWTYTFMARNSFTKIPLGLFVGAQWRDIWTSA